MLLHTEQRKIFAFTSRIAVASASASAGRALEDVIREPRRRLAADAGELGQLVDEVCERRAVMVAVEWQETGVALQRTPLEPGIFIPPVIAPIDDCISSSTLRAASLTAALTRSCSISTSFGIDGFLVDGDREQLLVAGHLGLDHPAAGRAFDADRGHLALHLVLHLLRLFHQLFDVHRFSFTSSPPRCLRNALSDGIVAQRRRLVLARGRPPRPAPRPSVSHRSIVLAVQLAMRSARWRLGVA